MSGSVYPLTPGHPCTGGTDLTDVAMIVERGHLKWAVVDVLFATCVANHTAPALAWRPG